MVSRQRLRTMGLAPNVGAGSTKTAVTACPVPAALSDFPGSAMAMSEVSQWLHDNVHNTEWPMLKMGVNVALENRKRIKREWCVVCCRAAVEDHPVRFHAAGGCLAGPFCSGRCAWHWLRDDRISDGEYPPEVVREVYREGTDPMEFERYSTAEELASAMAGGQPVTLFPRGEA